MAVSPRSWLESPRQLAVALLCLAVAALVALSLVSFVVWQRDLREIREIVAAEIDGDAPPDQIVQSARQFLEEHVGYDRTDSYFLLPAFRFMRPTTLQVIEQGGDCAYRTRAFIVILNLFDIEASKRALYSPRGNPVHAVAKVQTAEGPYYVDVLYNIAHEGEAGRPLSLAQLADEDVLRESIARAVADGNERAAAYPIDYYNFADVRTINWDKNILTKAAYRLAVLTVGEDAARRIPRPYLSEEPALMVIVLSMGTSLVLLLVVWRLSRQGRAIAVQSAIAVKAHPRS